MGMRKMFRSIVRRRRLWGYYDEAEVALKTLFRRELPEPRFVIFAQGRSGSTLLCELLGSHPKIHCDFEILANPVRDLHRYLRRSALASTQSAYGFKVKIYQLTKQQQVGNVAGFLQRMHKDGWRIVYLVRRNLFRQVFSGEARLVRGTSHTGRSPDGLVPSRPLLVHVDVKNILHQMRWRQRLQKQEREALKGLPFKTLVYEDDLYQPVDQQLAVGALVEWLGLTPEPVHTNLMPNTPHNLREVIANFGELEAGLRGTEFEAYFWEATGG